MPILGRCLLACATLYMLAVAFRLYSRVALVAIALPAFCFGLHTVAPALRLHLAATWQYVVGAEIPESALVLCC